MGSFCLFSPILTYDFTNWDDPDYILDNPLIRDLSFPHLKKIFFSHLNGKYHPLSLITYALEYRYFHLLPAVYHWNNLGLHLFNIVLVYLFISILFKNNGMALIVTSLFAIHPFQVEPVAWISGRKDVLYTFFFLVSLLFYLCKFTLIQNKHLLLRFSLLAFLLSLFSKAMAVSLPLILLLIDYYNNGRIQKKDIIEKWPYFLISFVFGLITIFTIKSVNAFPNTQSVSILDRILFSSQAYMTYLLKLIIPLKMSCYYPLPTDYFLSSLSLASVALLFYFSIKAKNKIWIFSLSFFTIMIAPVLHLIEVNDSIIYDRFVYLPSLGIFLMLGYLMFEYWRKWEGRSPFLKWTVVFLCYCYIAILLFISYNRSFVWKDSETLWQDVIGKYPQAAIAYHNLGSFYSEQGYYDIALLNFEKAIQLEPGYMTAYYNKGNNLAAMGDYSQALDAYSKALELDPGYVKALNNRANMYLLNGQYDLALKDYNRAIAFDPWNVAPYYNRAVLYYTMNNIPLALADLERALILDPGNFLAIKRKIEIEKKSLSDTQSQMIKTP